MSGVPLDLRVVQTEPLDGTPSSPARRFYVVGIGASAGGLEALERLFEQMPLETGMAFVVVQHLSPDFKSLMDELLARKTQIPIHKATDGIEVQPNAIYLIPPRKDMIVANGRLLLTDKDPTQLLTLPIDHFFRSLAHDQGERAIAIVLSGTGSDGSRGIRDIHEAGGLVIAQMPETAKFDGMPNSACKTGAVDLVLPPEQVPAALLRYIGHPLVQEPHHAVPAAPESSIDAVFRMLRDAYGIDFSHYKGSTVSRRIERRLLLNRSEDLDDYVRRLNESPEEVNALYKDLLIGVTRFFRDTEAFERLSSEVLPKLLAEVGPDEDFRVWVAGAATGEEAYSLAMLIHEQCMQMPRPVRVKIFATDMHRESLDFASIGLYSDAQVAEVSPQRLARYFLKKSEGYQVCSDLRQMVVFAPHNVVKDSPFTKLDLISCRNLLIYLQPAAQKKALSLFHFALKTNGALFLGPSESPGELSDEFATVDTHWKIYRKRRDVRLPAEVRLTLLGNPALPPAPTTGFVTRVTPASGLDHQLVGAYDALLDQWMPPSVLVNENRQLVQSFAGANRYLHLKDGRLSTDVLDMIDPELRIVLGGALPRVILEKTPVTYKGLRVRQSDRDSLVTLTVRPVTSRRSSATYALVIFQDDHVAPLPLTGAEVDLQQASRDQFHAVESELRYTKENLQATIEELETSNEELQATNEELLASNEELQSTNEELHSVNEELYTVNAEYQKKITELTELTADMDNLLASTQVHTLFLDEDLRIRKFTPQIAESFNLLPQDIGRKIESFTHNIEHAGLMDEIRRVMAGGDCYEQQVRDRHGRWFLLRILPYRTQEGIEGVVLTLVDLTNLKKAEAEIWKKDHQLGAILKNSPHLVFLKNKDGRYLAAAPRFRDVAGCDPVGKTAFDIFPAETAAAMTALDRRVLAEGHAVEQEIVIPHADGLHTYLSVEFPLRDELEAIIGVGGIKTDVTGLKAAEREARVAVEQRDRFLALLSHELRNPLGAIVNAGFVLDRTKDSPSELSRAIQVIERQSAQMNRLLDDLLDVSRITQNKIQLKRAPMRLNDLCEEAARAVHSVFEARQVVLHVCYPDETLVVDGDEQRLQQILVNLLANAAKYTPAGGHATLTLERQGDEAAIRVKDTGVGLRREMLERIFDLFVQVDETLDRSGSGLGVGLTLVRSIAELHGGRVRACSDGVDQGSEFVVTLPLLAESALQDASAPRDGHHLSPGRILIVEDNDDSRRMLETILRLDGHTVASARDGKEGLEAIIRDRPMLAIVDIGLPELDGYELSRQVRENLGNQIFLVALTGYGRPEDHRAVMEAGFDAHLVKPLDLRRLQEILKGALSKTKSEPTR